jgi:hypothetical protein
VESERNDVLEKLADSEAMVSWGGGMEEGSGERGDLDSDND